MGERQPKQHKDRLAVLKKGLRMTLLTVFLSACGSDQAQWVNNPEVCLAASLDAEQSQQCPTYVSLVPIPTLYRDIHGNITKNPINEYPIPALAQIVLMGEDEYGNLKVMYWGSDGDPTQIDGAWQDVLVDPKDLPSFSAEWLE